VPILYVVSTGARPAGDLPRLLPLLIERGWTCCVTLTPNATRFVDQAVLKELSGYPVRSVYKQPDEPDVHPAADCFLVAPLTFNSLNRWADGHSDTLALGLLNEALGLRRPIVAVPWINAALAAHPVVPGNIARLQGAGVRFILGNGLLSEAGPDPAAASRFPWDEALDALPAPGRDEEPLSEDEQDAIVAELAVNGETLSEEEFERLYRQLDVGHQIQVNDNAREFADNAVGDEHWDSDN